MSTEFKVRLDFFVLNILLLVPSFTAPIKNSVQLQCNSSIIDLSPLGNVIFGRPSMKTGTKLKNRDKNSKVNPEETGEYFEGDILVSGATDETLIFEKWPNATVPYLLEDGFTNEDVETIQKAIKQFHKFTCVRFIRKNDTDKDFLRISSDKTGCWSGVGKIGKTQLLNLQSPECLYTLGSVMHQFMHSIGFMHEQNRYDRDEFVNIIWDNVDEDMKKNFRKSFAMEFPYDYDSVTHYSDVAFTKNGKSTIKPKGVDAQIGQRHGFSKGDILRINKFYNCST